MNLDKDGTGDESTLVKRRRNNLEFIDPDAKIDKKWDWRGQNFR